MVGGKSISAIAFVGVLAILCGCGDDDGGGTERDAGQSTGDAGGGADASTPESDATTPMADAAPRDTGGEPPGDADTPPPPPPPPPTRMAGCEPFGPPTGTVVDVTPDMADELPSIVSEAASDTTIVLADGTYPITGTLA